ncbi:MAG: hypothetical protein E6H04_10830, partial [Bacillati bacterium ANGP1]
MRRATALVLGAILPLLGLSGVGQAQSSLQIQGTIQAVDCQAQTVVLSGPGSANTIAAAPYTAVLVSATSVPFCTLAQYIGAETTVWLVPTGNEFRATRIDVLGPVAVVPAPPPQVVAAPLPIAEIVLGTIVVAGLVYLLVRDNDGRYYRYPYYGPYYRHYYRPEYRSYFGPYPPLAPVIFVPAPIVGVVVGTVILGGFEHLLARGPYHRYYYRPEYRPYTGSYHDASVRQGDPHWDAPAYRDAHHQGSPGYRDPGRRAPVPQSTPRWTPPSPQNAPAYRTPNWTPPALQDQHRRDAPAYHGGGDAAPMPGGDPRWAAPTHRDGQVGPGYRDPGGRGPAPQGAPRWAPPSSQNAPAYHNPRWTPPGHQAGRREEAPRHYRTDPQCGDRGP